MSNQAAPAGLLCAALFLACGGGGGAGSSAEPAGPYSVPAEAMAEDVSSPDHVIGTGTPASCTAAAFIDAVAQGERSPSMAAPTPSP